MANMHAAAQVLVGDLIALDRVHQDLTDLVEELGLSEEYMGAEKDVLTNCKGAVRLVYESLIEIRVQLEYTAQARASRDSADILATGPIIDQPVSPANVPEVKKP